MPCQDLQLDCPGLRVTDLSTESDAVTVHAEAFGPTAACPHCGEVSTRVHSRYTRCIADLPTQGRRLIYKLSARRFLCVRANCPRKAFCERVPKLVDAHARTTGPLTESHREIGFVLGGEAGARLAEKLAVPTSPDTLLRRVQSAPQQSYPTPRFVGV